MISSRLVKHAGEGIRKGLGAENGAGAFAIGKWVLPECIGMDHLKGVG
jgi:hypothetical protein